MKRIVLLAAVFTIATSARAAIGFDRGSVVLVIGEETIVGAYATSFGTGGVAEFTSCDPSVALISGRVVVDRFTGYGSVHIRGVRGGHTAVCLSGVPVLPVRVLAPQTPSKRRAARH